MAAIKGQDTKPEMQVRKKAAEITHNMYQINFTLPESKH